MRPIRRILVAVKDTGRGSAAAIRKAAALALALDAQLQLFHAINETVAMEMLTALDENLQTYGKGERRRHLKKLDAIAAKLRRVGVDVTTAVEWDYPAHEAVVRAALRSGADLIVADRHARRHVAPWFLQYTDWELLRQSPVPVRLVKRACRYRRPRLLAAVDPSHAFEKTALLDQRILRTAAAVSAATGGQLHVVHARLPDVISMAPSGPEKPGAARRLMDRTQAIAARDMSRTLRAARLGKLPASRRYLVAQNPLVAIPQLAHRRRCDIVVMGALSRSGVKRLLLGNTAERLFDELPCDLLVVKPESFRTQVATRLRGPQLIALMNYQAG